MFVKKVPLFEKKNEKNNLGQSRLVEAFVRKLSEAADVEKEQNEKEKQKQHGQEVRYGQLIQLLHVKSNKYLTGTCYNTKNLWDLIQNLNF